MAPPLGDDLLSERSIQEGSLLKDSSERRALLGIG